MLARGHTCHNISWPSGNQSLCSAYGTWLTSVEESKEHTRTCPLEGVTRYVHATGTDVLGHLLSSGHPVTCLPSLILPIYPQFAERKSRLSNLPRHLFDVNLNSELILVWLHSTFHNTINYFMYYTCGFLSMHDYICISEKLCMSVCNEHVIEEYALWFKWMRLPHDSELLRAVCSSSQDL